MKRLKETNILGVTLICVLILLAFVIVFTGVAYAYWQRNYEQTETNELSSGCFSFNLTDSESIKLDNAYPISESEAMNNTPYTFTITNNCSIDMYYNVTLNTTGSSDLDSYLDYKLIDEDNATYGPAIIGSMPTYSDYNNYTYQENEEEYNIISSYILLTGNLGHATMNSDNTNVVEVGQSKTYKLYIWMDEAVEDLSTMGKTFEGKVIVTAATTAIE
jgi:hypothetical protein